MDLSRPPAYMALRIQIPMDQTMELVPLPDLAVV